MTYCGQSFCKNHRLEVEVKSAVSANFWENLKALMTDFGGFFGIFYKDKGQ